MKFPYNYLLLLLICLNFSYAQKSAPVAGDAAQLMDLLNKDYNSVSPELKNEEISKDMFKVISIFKSYLTNNERASFTDKSKTKSCKDIFTEIFKDNTFKKRWTESTANQEIVGIDIAGTDSDNINSICTYISKLRIEFEGFNQLKQVTTYKEGSEDNGTPQYNELEKKKSKYFTSKFFSDTKTLKYLGMTYEGSGNTYLNHIVKLFITKYSIVFNSEDDFTAQVNYSSSIQKSLPFLGGDLSFETIIDGLSRFLAKRIKEELTTHAIEKIQNYLNNPSESSYLNELLVLLPKTTDYLKSFEASQVLNFTDDFKQYIEKDLNNLLANTANLKTTPRFKKLINNNPDIGFAFEALDLIPQISKIKEPLDYFEIIENSPNLQRWANNPKEVVKFNIANTIKLTSLLAHSLLVIDDGKQKLVSLDFMSNYGSESEFYMLYIGFLNQQQLKYFNVKFAKSDGTALAVDFKNLITNVGPDKVKITEKTIRFFKEHINKVITNVEKLQDDIEEIKKANKNNEKVEVSQLHSLVNTLIEFSESLVETADDIIKKGDALYLVSSTIDTTTVLRKTKPYFNTARSVNDIFLDLHNKNYTTAIISALEIPSNFTNNTISLTTVTNLSNALEFSDNLRLLKTFINTTKIPNSKEKKKALKDIAVLVEQIINDPLDPKLASLKIQFIKVHNAIKSDLDADFKRDIKNLKNEFISNFEKVYDEYADIALTNSIIKPIEAYIDKGGLKSNAITELKGYLSDVVKNTFKAYLLDDDSDLKESKEVFLRYFTVYLPELTKNVFKIKDKNVLKIVHFITDIAVSENAQDVESAIEAFALPAGSSSAKEETSSYISINSYPGILGGFELSDQANTKTATHLGITAPIGIYGQFFKSKRGSWGLFIPIIDIGAPVRLRLDDNDNTETLPDFDFKDIFSPGAYISYGFNNSPFAINAGIQYGPKLKDIDNGSGVFNDIEVYRISLGLVIDIPLFTLFNKGID